ncbi:hypothetical protein Cfor_01761 [Coptotermes formosanus]|uniref:Uncharacterized protein n=1 Tax=Coptotermes formosanus TaxID=36987 RepID=A0A6L2PV32_COPFO|nr:hypothetical protein Cfor_01761 [Coptotermes formosanus]
MSSTASQLPGFHVGKIPLASHFVSATPSIAFLSDLEVFPPRTSLTGPKEEGIDDEDSSEGNVDLNEELYPIGYYINDREEMINQMFSVIKGSKLRAMLPPILKDSTIDELKSQCLDELLGMSSKRIHSVLEGRELETSSDSDEASSSPENGKFSMSDDDVTGQQTKDLEELDKKDCMGNERNGRLKGPVPDVDTLEIGITKVEMGELLNYVPPTKQCERKRSSSACDTEPAGVVAKKSKSKVNNQRPAKEPEMQIKGTARKNAVKPEEVGSPSTAGSVNEEDLTRKTDESKGKTLLEILELEMRARAIRALLKQQTVGDGEDVETCDEEPETSPSEVNKGSTLNTVCDAVVSGKDNAVVSKSFDTSPKPIRQKFGRKGKDNVPPNQSVVNADHTNNLCSTASLKVSLDIRSIPQLPSSTQNTELYSATKTDPTAGIKRCGLNRDVDQAANGDSSQDDSDDELLELNTSSKTQRISVQQTDDTQKLSNKKLPLYDNHSNDSSTRTEMSGTLTSASKQCNLRHHKSSVSYEISGSTKENLAQNQSEEFFETEINERYTSEDQCKRSDTTAECSWATRWLQSKDVQKVVSTSKMCAKIRKRMKSAQKVKKVISVMNDPDKSCKSVVIVGSVNEYNMLDKPKSGDGETAESIGREMEQNNS